MDKKHELISVKIYIQTEVIEFTAFFDRYSLIVLISRLDCEMRPNFSY